MIVSGRRPAMFALSLAALLCPMDVGAQTPEGSRSSALERLTALFSDLPSTQAVQIVTPRFLLENAYVEGLSQGFVELTQDGTEVSLDLTEVRTVSVRDNHWLQGALWGGSVGALVGGLAGMMVSSFNCTTAASCNDAEQAGAVRWATVFGVGGAVGGFVIGRYSFYWKPVFP
jgi:hypothetical protein